MTQKKIKAIVFDLDGTIADTFHIGLEVANQLAGKYKYEKIVDSPVIRDLSFKEFLTSHLNLGKIRLIMWAREVRRIIAHKYDDVEIFPGIKEMLSELSKNYQLGVLTSNSTKNAITILKNNSIEHFFSFMYTNCSAFGKGRYIKKLLKTEKLKRNELIYVGDEVRDVDACRSVDIKIIAVTWGANSLKTLQYAGADYFASKPWDITHILSSIAQ